jgi:hypothetical protein
MILTTLYLASAKNTYSWHARKGDMQCGFPLSVSMVPTSVLTVNAEDECLSCDVFSLGETIQFGSLKFITDHFDGLSLSPMGYGSTTVVMGSTHGGPPSPLQATIGDSIEEFHMTLNIEGRIDFPSPRRHDTRASTAPATTIPWSETTPSAQAMMTILSR